MVREVWAMPTSRRPIVCFTLPETTSRSKTVPHALSLLGIQGLSAVPARAAEGWAALGALGDHQIPTSFEARDLLPRHR
jgi:hypothetical protein